MTQELAVFAAASYNSATLTAELTTLNTANPITLLVTGGFNIPEQACNAWAITNGVPWIAMDPKLDALGCTAFLKPIYTIRWTTPSNILTAGTSARTTAASGAAAANGLPLTAI